MDYGTHACDDQGTHCGDRSPSAQAPVLPVTEQHGERAQEAFCQSLFPVRRPRFQVGGALPHGLTGWRFGELLGVGGFGVVWQVHHERLRKGSGAWRAPPTTTWRALAGRQTALAND